MMADEHQLAMLRDGVRHWNSWRKANPEIAIDLSKADLQTMDLWEVDLHEAQLHGANLCNAQLYRADLHGAHLHRAQLYRAYLSGADVHGVDLSEANLRKANLVGADMSAANLIAADLSEVDLREADLHEGYLSGANLCRADATAANLREASLCSADLRGANLTRADLSRADLSGADLGGALCVDTIFAQATLSDCRVHGTTTWHVDLEGAVQEALCVTPHDRPEVTVDQLEVAQFIYLMLNHQRIRDVVQALTSRFVLILGCFGVERKVVLDALRGELRRQGYAPVVMNFEAPAAVDVSDMVSTLARMARFLIVDLTDVHNLPHQVVSVLPGISSVTVQPLMEAGGIDPTWLPEWRQDPRVLDLYCYPHLDGLVASVKECVIDPAENRASALLP
ncbi:MAG: pentapeptide repeat-containing protein [Ktedonobacterales bacterium]